MHSFISKHNIYMLDSVRLIPAVGDFCRLKLVRYFSVSYCLHGDINSYCNDINMLFISFLDVSAAVALFIWLPS